MSVHHKPSVLLDRDEVVAAPMQRACEDRTFEIPTVLYALSGLFFLGFVTVLSVAFSGGMLVSYGVFVAFLVAFFTVPALWARMEPEEDSSRSLGWTELIENGVVTATGRTSGVETTVLVLLLPFLIFSWAVSIAVIASLV